jgi:hypothetical protein
VARRAKARRIKILEDLPGARQPTSTIAHTTTRDTAPPAAPRLVAFRQPLTRCCTADHASRSARICSEHALSCISLLHTQFYPP